MPHCKKCEECPFPSFQQGVDYKGPLDAPLVWVGESPGAMEVSEGEPFVGPSGGVLDGTVPPELVDVPALYLNALKCRPVNKDSSTMSEAVGICRNRLMAQLRLHPRKLIISLGGPAIVSLTGTSGIKVTQIRGRLFPSDLAELGILATVHPAFLMRGGGSYRQFKEDLQKASDVYQRKWTPGFSEPQYHVLTGATLYKTFQHMAFYSHIAADIETTGLNPRTDKILCIGLSIDAENCYIVPEELLHHHDTYYGLKLLMEPQMGCNVIWHNGKFDSSFLKAANLPYPFDEDTMLLSYAIDEHGGIHDLDSVAEDYVGLPPHKGMLDKYLPNKKTSYSVIPKPILYEYLGKDCSATLQAFSILRSRVRKDPALELLYTKTLIPASRFLQKVEERGIAMDPAVLKRNSKELIAEVAKQRQKVNDFSVLDRNPNSPPQMVDMLFNELMIRMPNGVKPISTDAKKVLSKLEDKPAVAALLSYRKIAKQYSTYIKPFMELTKDAARIHSTFKLHGTKTGRLASDKPNMQNIPRDSKIRGQFCAPEGKLLLEADFSQAELRVLTVLSNDDYLIQVYREGRKLHEEMTRFLFKMSDERVFDKDDPEIAEWLMRAKAVNFGIPYGRTKYSIASEFDVTNEVAQEWIDSWFKKAPQAKEYIDILRATPSNQEVITTCFGRKRRFGLVSRDNIRAYRNEASNFPIQSIASDLTLHTAIMSDSALEEMGVLIVNLVHDSIVMEMDNNPALVREAFRLVSDNAQLVVKKWLKTDLEFPMDPKIGTHWGDPEKRIDIDMAA